MNERRSGFYWVKRGDSWTVGEWTVFPKGYADRWTFVGDDEFYDACDEAHFGWIVGAHLEEPRRRRGR